MSSLESPSTQSVEAPGCESVPGQESPSSVAIEFGAMTDKGKIRNRNEDHFLVARLAKSMTVCRTSLPDDGRTRFSEEEGYLMIVADGMGGAAAGERASAVAVESVERFVLDTLKWFLHLEGREEHALFAELRQGLEHADRDVIERARLDPRLHGMGTTMTMAYSVGTDLFIVHAGDSRAYLFHDGELQQLTSDHTLVQVLVQGGAITPEDAKKHRNRNIVTNVVGGPREGVFAEIHKLKVADGDVLLLCSDGLTEPVADDAIAEILASNENAEEACARLIERALERGAPDNVTAIVSRFHIT
jgi:serine/threonine protein phosphatase PrpC